MKIYLRPFETEIRSDNGIGRVIVAMHRHLPALGFEFVTDQRAADLIACHTRRFDAARLDVLHVHGLYWMDDPTSAEYSQWHLNANAGIIEAARLARSITVPSRWVAMPFKRDMRLSPTVINHGIDVSEWTPGQNDGYVLWNKNRVFDVCRPDAPYELAKRGVNIMSTFAPSGVKVPDNMQVIGRQEPEAMRNIIRRADLYLATTPETFGIGTLEALACGVPVVGWDYGGTAEIVTNGVDGLLVKPGDYEALYAAVQEAHQRRAELSQNARRTAARYDWPSIMTQYAELYERVAEAIHIENRRVSIVITAFNYGRYVGEAVTSALHQTRPPDEVIVVDDGSTDETPQVLEMFGDQIKIIRQANAGVAAARTAGITAAQGAFVTCLDADDRLDPRFIETLLPAIQPRDIGIVYSGITLFDDKRSWLSNGFPPDFSWERQAQAVNPPANCIPSACLFRREMWQRAGPHKQEYAPGEDAEFWTRGLSIGYKAVKVTSAGLFWYRLHNNSASRRLKYRSIDDRLPWLRDKRFPMAAPSEFAPLVMSYSQPKVAVVIAVKAETVRYLPDALDALLGQTMRDWQVIVSGQVEPIERYPFVEWVPSTAKTLGGVLAAGLLRVTAPLVIFQSAADMLTNSALEEMLKAFVNSGGRYIYTDRLILADDGRVTPLSTPAFTQRIRREPPHALAALVPTDWARSIGVDGAFYARLALAGYCGQRLGRPLVIEREKISVTLRANATTIARLERGSMSACCGGNAEALLAARQALTGMTIKAGAIDHLPDHVRLDYIGENIGAITFAGRNGREYRGGRNEVDGTALVHRDDVPKLIATGRWRVSEQQPIQAIEAPAVSAQDVETIEMPAPPERPLIDFDQITPETEAAMNAATAEAMSKAAATRRSSSAKRRTHGH